MQDHMLRSSFASIMVLLAALVAASPAAADVSLAGKYSDGNLAIDLAESAGAYTGTITLGSQQFPASARANGHRLDGTFSSGGNSYSFTAALADDTLTLTTARTTYTLKRVSPPPNPLAKQAPANPLSQPAPAAAAGDEPAGYTVVATTNSGKSLTVQKADATSVRAALEATFPDLARYFGERPAIAVAYEDSKDHKSGGATFTAKLNGQPIRGFVSCKLAEQGGATVTVIYGRTDAPKAEWDKLLNPQAADAPADAALAKVLGNNAYVYQFPDGTASITLAEGWKTPAQSVLNPVFIEGPGDQTIWFNNKFTIYTPDAPFLQQIRQNEAMLQRAGGNQPRRVTLVAAFTDPVQALTDLYPQLSEVSQSNGGTAYRLDKIISHQDVATEVPNAKKALVSTELTRTKNGKATLYRDDEAVLMFPSGSGSWTMVTGGIAAPAATFDHDKPLMEAMANSIHQNGDVITQRQNEMLQQQAANLQQMQQAQNQQFANQQAQHAQMMKGFAQHNQQWAAGQLQKSRQNANFVESIRGSRTIYDTLTGERGTTDLNYASGVVNSLNTAANDPNRFVQIPLRDEMYPAAPGK